MRELLRAVHVRKYYEHKSSIVRKASVKAVDGVSFTIHVGDSFGLVGESGCGKTTLGRLCVGLIRPSAGELTLNGVNLSGLRKKDLRTARRDVQLVFQDPEGSLNPRMTVADLVSEPLETIDDRKPRDARNRTIRTLEQVGLGDIHLHRYPHELSGGQKQRVGIARALITSPAFIVLDEPTAALDLLVQAQILNILRSAHKTLSLAYMFITHDMGVMQYMCAYTGVMYLGKFVEMGPTNAILRAPAHPYTRALLSSVVSANPQQEETDRIVLKGEVPSPLNPPPGCSFHPRCDWAGPECRETEPELKESGEGHLVACIRPESAAQGLS